MLLFVDPVDDFWTSVIHEYKDQKFKSVTRADVDLEKFSSEEGKKDEENKSDENKSEENADSILEYFTKVLGSLVKV